MSGRGYQPTASGVMPTLPPRFVPAGSSVAGEKREKREKLASRLYEILVAEASSGTEYDQLALEAVYAADALIAALKRPPHTDVARSDAADGGTDA